MRVYFLIKIHLQPNHCLIILAEETINAISNALRWFSNKKNNCEKSSLKCENNKVSTLNKNNKKNNEEKTTLCVYIF